MRSTWMMNLSGGAMIALLLAQSAGTQQHASAQTGGDWPMYRRDRAGTGYSPLAQINAKNVAGLTEVWTDRLPSDAPALSANIRAAAPSTGRGGAGGVNSEATPGRLAEALGLQMFSRREV